MATARTTALPELEIRLSSADGHGPAWVDGIRVVPAEGQSGSDVALERAQLLIKRAGVGSPRQMLVVASTPEGQVWRYILDENGEATDLGRAPTQPLVVERADDVDPAPRQREDDGSSSKRPHIRTLIRSRPWLAPAVIIAAGLVVLLLLALAFKAIFGSTGVSKVAMTTENVALTATPPLEWQADAIWRSPALAQDAGRALVIGGDKVALVTDKPRAVVLVEAATGKTLWSVKAPKEGLSGDLHATHIDGQVVVAVQAGNALHWWTLADGTPGKADLAETARTTWEGFGPVIRESPGEAALVQSGELKRFAVPPAATILAARKDGTVTAAAPQGWWHLTPGEQPAASPSAWEFGSTNPIQLQPVGYLNGRIITVLQPTSEGQPARIVVQRDAEKVRFEFVGSINPPLAEINRGRAGDTATGNRFHSATSGTWGIFGRSLIDLRTSTVTDLGAWQTVWVAADRAHGQINSEPVIAGPKIPPGVLQGGEAFPDDLTVAGALVRAKDGDDTFEYLLPPKTGQQ